MKKIYITLALISLLALTIIPFTTYANGNGTLGQIYNQTKAGLNYTTATQRLGQRFSPLGVAQPATFTISGIPTGAVIEKAFLFASSSGNGIAFNVTVKNPAAITFVYPMPLVGAGADKCWGYAASDAYRADVTTAVTGNGNYLISGLPTNPPIEGNDIDGATLMVIYSVPCAPYEGHLIIHDGSVVVNGGSATQTVTGINATANSIAARAFVGIGDIQMNGNLLTMNGNAAINVNWNWWNYEDRPTTITAGQSTATFTFQSSGDCWEWTLMGIYYQTPYDNDNDGVGNDCDCAPTDPGRWQLGFFYTDADGDNFTVGNAVQLCYGASTPNGYKATKSSTDDCNDANSSVWVNGTFYADADGDNYTVGNGVILCYGASTPNGYKATKSSTDDCDDSNSSAWVNGTFYVDADGDNYTIGNGVILCYGASTPNGYKATKSSTDDCDDSNSSAWLNGTFYVDADGDNYTVGNGVILCYGAATPAGYKSVKSATDDCNDSDPLLYVVETWYQDMDGDGYAGSIVNSCGVPAGNNWSTTKIPGGDCDDNDDDINPSTQWWQDKDGDGYGNANNSIFGCNPGVGWTRNNYDCDDNSTAKRPEDERLLMCHNGKLQCVKVKEVPQMLNNKDEQWTLGPCSSPCKAGMVLMCHNGKPQCVNAKEVQDHLSKKGWSLGYCGDLPAENLNNSITSVTKLPATTQVTRGDEMEVSIPRLSVSNFPNPFTSSTVIQYQLPVAGKVSLKVYDLLGRPIKNLINSNMNAGIYNVSFDAGTLSKGNYYYRIIVQTENNKQISKIGRMSLIR